MTDRRNSHRPTLALHALAALFLTTAAASSTGCAAPAACPPAHPAAPPPPAPAATAPAVEVVQPVVHVSPEPGPPTAAMMRGLPDLPRPSPSAEVKQRVGLTDLHVEYSSPGVKGREVFGKVVPLGELWRTGANAPTKLTASRDFTFGGKSVPAGRYSLFTIPTDTTWTVILNRDPKEQGSFEHNAKDDVARIEVPSSKIASRERLTFLFEDSTDDATKLVLEWADRRVVVPITVDTKAHVDKGIAETLDNAWRPLFNAGRYAFDQGDDARALALLQQSIGIQGSWWNHWWAAQVLAKQKQHAAAREHANKAIELGKDDAVFKRAFADQVKKALESWPKS